MYTNPWRENVKLWKQWHDWTGKDKQNIFAESVLSDVSLIWEGKCNLLSLWHYIKSLIQDVLLLNYGDA